MFTAKMAEQDFSKIAQSGHTGHKSAANRTRSLAICKFTHNCIEKTKIKKKEAGKVRV